MNANVNKSKQPREVWLLMGLHALLAVLIPAVFLLLAGCTTDLKEEEISLGPEVSQEKVVDALISAWENTSPYNMQPGEGVLYDVNQWIETSPAMNVGALIRVVIDREDQGDLIKITVRRREITVDENGKQQVTERDEDPVILPKPELIQSLPPQKGIQMMASALKALQGSSIAEVSPFAEGEGDERMTYHDLKIEKTEIDPPQAIRERDNCNDLPNCKIVVTKISYDEVYWKGKQWTKQHFSYILSDHLTWLSRFVESCQKFMYETPDRSYLIRSCSQLKDFERGTPEADGASTFTALSHNM